jgi:glycosyltransferase involved in cell wall biosynthesis
MESGGFVKRRIIPRLLFVLEVLSFTVCDRIIVFNRAILDYSVLERFEHKTSRLRFNFEEIPASIDPVDSGTSVVYIGRICELKGAGDFAKAADRLLDRENIDIDEILFVGAGPTKERWEQYFEENDTEKTVTFTGWLSHEEAMEVLEASKIMALPSKSEGLPKTLIEAMARGVVPVATPVGNIPDVITDGEDGLLLEDTAPETIADAIETLVTESDLDKMAYRSHETAQEKFSYQTARNDFKALLTELQ